MFYRAQKTVGSAMVLFLVAAVGWSTSLWAADHQHSPAIGKAPQIIKAVAVLVSTAGNQVRGTVTFTVEGSKVRAVADVMGLTPSAKHGFHIHEFGDCSAPDAASAGGHFNPGGMPHGSPADAQHHGGDFGNLQADAEGKAHLELSLDQVTLDQGPGGILGRGIIVHAQVDDLKTQPTGNSGARVACGVIGIAKDGFKK